MFGCQLQALRGEWLGSAKHKAGGGRTCWHRLLSYRYDRRCCRKAYSLTTYNGYTLEQQQDEVGKDAPCKANLPSATNLQDCLKLHVRDV
eukprot:3654353-Amphidinium_carterae.1